MSFLLSPLGRWLAGLAIVSAAVLGLTLYAGHVQRDRAAAHVLAASEAVEIAGLKANAAHLAAQTRISDTAEQKQIVVQHDIQVQTRTIIQKVPVYVTPETDARCFVPVGLVRLYNAAVTGSDPGSLSDPAGRPDGAASGVACSELAADIVDNFSIARANAEQLSGLQAWTAAQADAVKP